MASAADVLSGQARWAVVCGDAVATMAGLGAAAVDHIISDPPYQQQLYDRIRGGIAVAMGRVSAARLASGEIGAIDDILVPCAQEMMRLARRWTIVFHDAECDGWRKEFGDRYVRTGIWIKPAPKPQFSGDRPGNGHETITMAHAPGRKRWHGGGRAAVWGHDHCRNTADEDRPDHPCPKPLSLMMELVEQFTDPGEVVLDPFCGSGTTGVACLRLGRRFIGVDKSEQFCELSTTRLRAEESSSTLRGELAGQLALFGGGGGDA